MSILAPELRGSWSWNFHYCNWFVSVLFFIFFLICWCKRGSNFFAGMSNLSYLKKFLCLKEHWQILWENANIWKRSTNAAKHKSFSQLYQIILRSCQTFRRKLVLAPSMNFFSWSFFVGKSLFTVPWHSFFQLYSLNQCCTSYLFLQWKS